MNKQAIIVISLYAAVFLFTYALLGLSWFLPVAGLFVYIFLRLFLPSFIAAFVAAPTGKRIVSVIRGLILTSASAALIYATIFSALPIMLTSLGTSLISVFTMQSIYDQHVGTANIKNSDKRNNSAEATVNVTQRIRSHAENIALSASYMLLILPTLNFALNMALGIDALSIFSHLAESAIWLQAAIGLSEFQPNQSSFALNFSIGLIIIGRVSLMLISTLLLTTLPFGSQAIQKIYNLLFQVYQKFLLPFTNISVLTGSIIIESRQAKGLQPTASTVTSETFEHFKSQFSQHKNRTTAPAA
jgi:hypothetical protein